MFICMIIKNFKVKSNMAGRIKKKTQTHNNHWNMEKCMADIISPKDHTSTNTDLESDHILALYITLKDTMFS